MEDRSLIAIYHACHTQKDENTFIYNSHGGIIQDIPHAMTQSIASQSQENRNHINCCLSPFFTENILITSKSGETIQTSRN